jgi:hypothetical protein
MKRRFSCGRRDKLKFLRTLEFEVSEVSRERDRDTVGEKTQNKEEVTRGRKGDFPSSFGNNEVKYHFEFRVSGFQESRSRVA